MKLNIPPAWLKQAGENPTVCDSHLISLKK